MNNLSNRIIISLIDDKSLLEPLYKISFFGEVLDLANDFETQNISAIDVNEIINEINEQINVLVIWNCTKPSSKFIGIESSNRIIISSIVDEEEEEELYEITFEGQAEDYGYNDSTDYLSDVDVEEIAKEVQLETNSLIIWECSKPNYCVGFEGDSFLLC